MPWLHIHKLVAKGNITTTIYTSPWRYTQTWFPEATTGLVTQSLVLKAVGVTITTTVPEAVASPGGRVVEPLDREIRARTTVVL